ncbi:MAG: GNAT family N-acetyltransferase [Thermoplasmata archaeon]
MPRVILRDLRWEDFESLTESYWELYDERDRGEPVGVLLFAERPSAAAEAAWFSGLYQRTLKGEEIAVVAETEGQAVGLCQIRPASVQGPTGEGGHVGELGILVHHRHRGQGVGRAMIERALELAMPRYEIVRLKVFANNERAKRLYQELGFVLCGRLPNAIRRGSTYIDEEEMYIDLRRPDSSGAPTKR